MANYIGKVQIGSNDAALIGSTLYGICTTPANEPAKKVTSTEDSSGKFINQNIDNVLQGTTIHIKFTLGNTVSSGLTLQVGNMIQSYNIVGNCLCNNNAIISFTFDENQNWIVNDEDTIYTFAEGTTNGTISVIPSGGTAQSVSVHGLGDSAYTGIAQSLSDNTTTTTDLPTANAVVQYVQIKTAGLSGLTGAMHFKGSVNNLPDATASTTYEQYDAGDVVLGPNNKEYVYNKSNLGAAQSQWIELGDEGSYVLIDSQTTDSAIKNVTLNPGTLPQLTVTPTNVLSGVTLQDGLVDVIETTAYTIPNVISTGSDSTYTLSQGVLSITLGSAPTLGTAFSVNSVNTASIQKMPVLNPSTVSVGSASGWEDGDLPSLNTPTSITVVTPVANP